MKRRFLSALLVLCMMLGFIPAAVPAANATTEQPRRRIMSGASGIAGGDITAKKWDYVYFGSYNGKPVKWRVLSTNGGGGSYKNADGESVAADSALFLLSEEILADGTYCGDSEADWKGETGREWCRSFSPDSDEEGAYILRTDKTEGVYELRINSYQATTLRDERYFLLSAKEAADYLGDYNLNTTRADGEKDMSGWWFRSHGVSEDEFGCCNYRFGCIAVDTLIGSETRTMGYRPAFCLDASKILFISSPEGKSAGDYSGDSWKLTMLDDSRNNFSSYVQVFQERARDTMDESAGVVYNDQYGLWVRYFGAQLGTNESISLVILDRDGNVKYYGCAKKGLTEEDGYARFLIPHGSYDRDSDRLFIFNEQKNGNYMTDFASPLVEVSLNNRFDLNLEKNGGSITEGKDINSYISGLVTPLPTADDITREGYLFTGWYTDSDFSGKPVTEINAKISGNLTFYAKWELTSEHIHTGEVKWVTNNSTHKKAWSCCGTVVETETAHIWSDDDICTVCGCKKQHIHCTCGTSLTSGNHKLHSNFTYSEWDGVSDIDYGATRTAYVFLTEDVVLQNNLEIDSRRTLVLCLNGKTLASDGTHKIILKGYSHIILCDCAGGGTVKGATSGWGGGAVYLYSSSMDMYGGKITGGSINGRGGGGAVILDDQDCTFSMYGGEISENHAARYGGAIYMKGGTVNLYGGIIRNNSAGWNGGAIYVQSGKINVSGNPVVKDNTKSGGANNIWLTNGSTLSVRDMTEGAEIGITTLSSEYPVVFSDACAADYSEYFFADNANAHVEYNENNQLELAAGAPVPSHKHKWASEWTTNETHHWHECTADGCDLTDNSQKKGYSTHGGEDDGDCTTPLLCSECGYTIAEKKDRHDFGEWVSVGDGTHKTTCKNAGCGQTSVKDCFGGKATCTKKAVCGTCGGEYGNLDPDNHSDLRHIEAKAATKTAEGNIEYWYCSGCGRYFADRDRTKEITKADTVTAKLTEDEPLPPATGETISLTLLTALLLISGGAVTTVISRKRRHGR